MVKALEKAEQTPPDELISLSNAFKEKVARGEAQWSHSGFGGEGYTFDASEMNEAQKAASMQRRQYEIEQGILPDKDESTDFLDEEDPEGPAGPLVQTAPVPGPPALDSSAFAALPPIEKAHAMARLLGAKSSNTVVAPTPAAAVDPKEALARARLIAQQMLNRTVGDEPTGSFGPAQTFSDELEINDYPPQVFI
jgi:ATP-dependent RNA helicase DDX46/PRP5